MRLLIAVLRLLLDIKSPSREVGKVWGYACHEVKRREGLK